jgi:hypothetical protein
MSGKAYGEHVLFAYAEIGYCSGLYVICSKNVNGHRAVMRIVKAAFTLDKRLVKSLF